MSVEKDGGEARKKKGTDETLQSLWLRCDFFSGQASKIGRQLAFAEGVVFWSLYTQMDCKPKMLVVAFYLVLILYFIIDLLQYMYGAYKFEQKAILRKESKKNDQKVPSVGDEIGKNIKMFFTIKLIVLIPSFFILIAMFTLYIYSS